METWSPEKMKQILTQYGKQGLTENTYNWLNSRVQRQKSLDPNSVFQNVAVSTKTYPVNWDQVKPVFGEKYIDLNIQTPTGDYIAGFDPEKSRLSTVMKSGNVNEIKKIQRQLADQGKYDYQLYELDSNGIKAAQKKLGVRGFYNGPIDGNLSEDLIQAYREFNVDGLYGGRTELALAQPNRQSVNPTKVDNTQTSATALLNNPTGRAITGGVYTIPGDGIKIQAPDNLVYPSLQESNWVRGVGQDTGAGNSWWNLIGLDGKSIKYIKNDQDKATYIEEERSKQIRDRALREIEKNKQLQDVLSWFTTHKNGGTIQSKTSGWLSKFPKK